MNSNTGQFKIISSEDRFELLIGSCYRMCQGHPIDFLPKYDQFWGPGPFLLTSSDYSQYGLGFKLGMGATNYQYSGITRPRSP